MNKRLLSFVLSIVFIYMCVPSFSVDASTIPVYDDDYDNTMHVLNTICPDFALSNGDVTTRGEFVAAVSMALNMPERMISQTGFSDVSADMEYAAHIAYARDMGLVSNVDLFYPQSPISYEQAIKIVMSACGYGKKAELTGGFPTGYIKAANDAGVGKNLEKANGDYLSHKEAATLIFEACVTDILEVTSFGDSFDYTRTEGKNIFSLYHGIHMAEGIVEANENTGLRSISSSCPEGFITIDGNNYKYDEETELIGKKARIFYKDNSKNEIVCAYECDNVEYFFTQDDSLSLSGTVLTVQASDSDKEIKHNLEDDYTIIYNGKCFNTLNPSSLIASLSGKLSLIDNNNNGRIDVIVIKEFEYAIAGSINEFEEKIYDKFKRNGVINLSEMNYSIAEENGIKIELGELEEDDALGIALSKDNKLCEIVRFGEKLGGTIDELTSEGKIVVSGNEYKLSSYYTEVIKPLSKLKLGSEVILVFGDGNRVIYVKEYSSDIKYGFFVSAAPGSGLNSKQMVMIFGSDGKMYELNIADSMKIDGIKKTKSEAYPIIEGIKDKDILLRVIKYSLNADGELKTLYTAKQNTEGTKVFLTRCEDEAQPVLYDDNTKHGYVATSASSSGKLVFKNDVFYPYFTMSPECVILKVPKNEDERLNARYYSLAPTSEVKDFAASNGDSVECYGYDVDIDGASFILWPSDVGGSSTVAEESSNAIVERLTRGVSPDGDNCYVLTLFADGKAEKYYSTQDSEAVVSTMKPGDIVQVSYNADREITAANINFVWQTKTIGGNAQAPQGYNGAKVGLATGYFYNFSDKTGMIVRGKTIEEISNATNSFEFTDMFPANLGRGKIYFVKFTYNRSSGAIEEAVVHTKSDTSSIESFYTAGKDADYMVQRARFHDISYTVIYTN